MSLPTSRLAYADCEKFFDSAIGDEHGARRCFKEWKGANYFRLRCHNFRVLDRKDNAETYEKGHKMHGVSIFDDLEITLREDTNGEWWVYAQKRSTSAGDIELLSTIEGEYEEVATLAGPDRLQIEHQAEEVKE